MLRKLFNPNPNMLASAAEKAKDAGFWKEQATTGIELSDKHIQEIERRTGLTAEQAGKCRGFITDYLISRYSYSNHLTPAELRAQLELTYNKASEFLKLVRSLHWETKGHIDIKFCMRDDDERCLSKLENHLEALRVNTSWARNEAPQPQRGVQQPSPNEQLFLSCYKLLTNAGISCDKVTKKSPLSILVSIILEAAGAELEETHRSIQATLKKNNI